MKSIVSLARPLPNPPHKGEGTKRIFGRVYRPLLLTNSLMPRRFLRVSLYIFIVIK